MSWTSVVSRYWHVLLLALTLVLALFIFLWPWQPPSPQDIFNKGLVYFNKFDNQDQFQLLSADRHGTPASALLLDGLDDFVLTKDSSINVKTDFTFTFWLKPLRNSVDQLLFMKGENCPDGNPHYVGFSFEVRIQANDKLSAMITAPAGNYTDEFIKMESQNAVPTSQWTFVSIRYDNTAKSFDLAYNLQKQAIKQSNKTSPKNFAEIYQSISPLKFGADENYCGFKHQFSNHYQGYLDDVYIFDRYLSATELGVLSGSQVSYSLWDRKSVPIIISLILLVIATALIGWVKAGYLGIGYSNKVLSRVRTKYDFEDMMIFLSAALGAVLAIAQFVYNRSLSNDEAMLALNIINRNPLELLEPLDFYIVGPILFLQIEKLFSLLIPNTDLALRTFPLIAFMASIYLLYRILMMIHTNKYAIIVGLALFAFNSPLIYYASEVKQYMIDVLAVSLIYFFLLKDYENIKLKFTYLGIAGTLCIFLSNVTPLILFTAGVFLVFQHDPRDISIRKYMITIFSAWTITFGIYFYSFIWHHPSAEAMANYWSPLYVFAPKNPFSKAFYVFLWDKWEMVRGRLFQFGQPGEKILSALLMVGILGLLLRRKLALLILIFLPILLHIFLSGYKMYPFDVRMILYTCPLFVIIFSFGVKELIDLLFADLNIQRIRILSFVIPVWFGTLFLSNGFYWTSFPFKKQEYKNNIIHLNENWQPGDGIYVFPAGIHLFNYYRDTKLFKISDHYVKLGHGHDTAEQHAQEISSLHGRQWILFGGDEDEVVLKLKELGYPIKDEFRDLSSSSFLFEFK